MSWGGVLCTDEASGDVGALETRRDANEIEIRAKLVGGITTLMGVKRAGIQLRNSNKGEAGGMDNQMNRSARECQVGEWVYDM